MKLQPVGVILAGGQGRRMGGVPKGDLMLGDRSLLSHVAERLAPQVDRLALNGAATGHDDLPRLSDGEWAGAGPLAGVLAGLRWAEGLGARHIVTAAVDTPFLPADLVPRLLLAGEDHPKGLAIAATADGWHGTFGLWPVALADDLEAALQGGTRKVTEWTAQRSAARAEFPTTQPPHFFNINTPADLTQARAWI